MARHIFYCKACDRFTLEDKCAICGNAAVSTVPAKFSPEDKWGKYRRMAKENKP